jgi:uncharacterized membrane protein YeiH
MYTITVSPPQRASGFLMRVCLVDLLIRSIRTYPYIWVRMAISFVDIIDILGTFSFAVSGAFAAMEKKLDPFGVLILSFITAIGGGTIRDLMLGVTPVSWLSNMRTVESILVAASMSMFLGSLLKKLHFLLFLFDALGLGLFTLIGIGRGLDHGLSIAICISLGMITGVFGGVLRDVLLNNVPLVFQKEIYASASMAGGGLFFLLLMIPMDRTIAGITAIITIVVLRILAVRFNWYLPRWYEKSQYKERS